MSINKIKREDVDNFAAVTKQVNALDYYQEIAGQSAIYPGKGAPGGIMYCALKLNGEAGELAEHVGKAMRDDNFGNIVPTSRMELEAITLTSERRNLILKEIGDVLWYCQALCRELNIPMSQVALMNLEKLCDRGERDVLQGSGDNR